MKYRRIARWIAVAVLAGAGIAVAPDSRASSTVTAVCDARPAAGSTLNLCDFTPAANGETLASATFEVTQNGLVSVQFSHVDYGEALLQMTLEIVLPGGPVTSLLDGEGFLQFEGVAGTKYTALIYLLPGESNFGLANMLITQQTSVPLPPAALLLASALLSGWRLARRRHAAA